MHKISKNITSAYFFHKKEYKNMKKILILQVECAERIEASINKL